MKAEQNQLKKATEDVGARINETKGEQTQSMIKKVVKNATTPKDIMGLSDAMVEGIYGQAYRLYNTGKYRDASQLFRLLIMLNTTEPKYPMGLAACFHMLKEYKSAADIYAIVAMLDPDNPVAYYHTSDCFIQAGDIMSAIIALEMAIKRAEGKPAFATLKDRAALTLESLKKELSKLQK